MSCCCNDFEFNWSKCVDHLSSFSFYSNSWCIHLKYSNIYNFCAKNNSKSTKFISFYCKHLVNPSSLHIFAILDILSQQKKLSYLYKYRHDEIHLKHLRNVHKWYESNISLIFYSIIFCVIMIKTYFGTCSR